MYIRLNIIIVLNLLDVRGNIGHRTNRQDFDQTVSRKHFLSPQDIRNYERKVRSRQVKRHENDALSVDILVQELMLEPFSPILVYKQQGVSLPDLPLLSKESFILVIQTEFQMMLYRKFCGKILYIDATHGTNAYRFKLITCLVVDEFNRGKYSIECIMFLFILGQPIAWCISDQETAYIIELFLKKIKEKSPSSTVTVLMTDDGMFL